MFKKQHIVHVINIFLFLFTFLLILQVHLSRDRWRYFSDPYDYLEQAKKPINSIDFWSPAKPDHLYARPFTTPLLYKIAGVFPASVINMQKFIHCLAIFLLFAAVQLFIKTSIGKYFFLFTWYFLMSWWAVVGWTSMVLSESFSISFFFIWLATYLFFIHSRKTYLLIIHIITTILFSFTRDSWPYIIFAFYLLSFAFIYFKHRKLFKVHKELILIVFALVLFFVQQKSADYGQRYRLPLINNIVFKILPYEDRTTYFISQGMPQVDQLKAQYSNLSDWKQIYSLYNNPEFIEFNDWVISKGKSVYMKYVINHPFQFMIWNASKEELKSIFSLNKEYIGNRRGYTQPSSETFPLFNLYFFIPLLIITVFLYIKRKEYILILPAVVTLIFFLNITLMFIADAIENGRHQYMNVILLQFLSILALALILDNLRFRKHG